MLALTNRQFLLKYQKEVFEHFVGSIDQYGEYRNPLRPDNSAGCSIIYYNGRMRLVDFASDKIHYDAFDLVMGYYNVDFYEAKSIIQNSFAGLGVIHQEETKSIQTGNTEIYYKSQVLCKLFKAYWSAYQITAEDLEEDKVLPISEFSIVKNGVTLYNRVIREGQFAFVYREWEEGVCKICCPFISGKGKWITNTNQNHIGNSQNIDFTGEHLVITKSYKDCRVLRNNGFENTIWFQNEGMIPDISTLKSIVNLYDKVTIVFDNDQAGIVASNKLAMLLKENTSSEIRELTIPKNFKKYKVKDPSDLIKFKQKHFNNFINNLSWQ